MRFKILLAGVAIASAGIYVGEVQPPFVSYFSSTPIAKVVETSIGTTGDTAPTPVASSDPAIALLESSVQGTNTCLTDAHALLPGWHEHGFPDLRTEWALFSTCLDAKTRMEKWLGCTESGCSGIPPSLRGNQAANDYASNGYLAAYAAWQVVDVAIARRSPSYNTPDSILAYTYPSWSGYDDAWASARAQLDGAG